MGPENGVQNLDRVLGSVIFLVFVAPKTRSRFRTPCRGPHCLIAHDFSQGDAEKGDTKQNACEKGRCLDNHSWAQ